VITFGESVAGVLRPRIVELAARWRERAHAATPRHVLVEQDAANQARAEAVVRAAVACLDRDARWQGEVMRLGWQAGADAHEAGLSVHHVLKDADLLLAILLAAAEDGARAGELPEGPGAVADALVVARRLQRAVGLHAQAAASSCLHAIVSAMRDRWRLLRHDLRNPLGTIRSALSLMEDETVPQEARSGPKIRAMVARNAGSLESLISARLDDRLAAALVAAPQEVSLRDVAVAVRRTLRDAVRLAECEIAVDDALPAARVDEAAAELTLSTLLLSGVACAAPGDVLRVQRGPERSRAVVLCVRRERVGGAAAAGDPWDPDSLALAIALAGEYGGHVVPARHHAAHPDARTDARAEAHASAHGDARDVARASTLELVLPLLPSVELRRAPDVQRPRRSDRHLRDDVPRAD
jgi:signal transduction histidine kinase